MNRFDNWFDTTHAPYKSTGKLLRQLAYLTLICGIIATVILGFDASFSPATRQWVSSTRYSSGYYRDVPAEFDWALFFTYIAAGIPSAFASGLVLHAMGDVVYSVMKTAGTLPEGAAVQSVATKPATVNTWVCPACKTENRMADGNCVECGTGKPMSGASANTNTWICPECKTSNAVFKGICMECGARKPHS